MEDKSLELSNLKIGISLSGGGMRAIVFHYGVLNRLAKEGLLDKVKFISTVSGGTLIIGLIYSMFNNAWPTSTALINDKSKIDRILTSIDLTTEMLLAGLKNITLLFNRPRLLSKVIREKWGVNTLLNIISKEPRWIINATTYETGKNWRFTYKRMGDYVANYVQYPGISLADVMASSAAYPGLIGPMKIESSNYEWGKYISDDEFSSINQEYSRFNLWDGGIYDNLGIEALFKPDRNYRDGMNFLIVSDASQVIKPQKYSINLITNYKRLLNIATDQIRCIRSREIVTKFKNKQNWGVYFNIGNEAKKILTNCVGKQDCFASIVDSCLDEDSVIKAKLYPTVLSKPTIKDFVNIFRHGWEVANCTLITYYPEIFKNIPYQETL